MCRICKRPRYRGQRLAYLYCATICRNHIIQAGRDPGTSLLQPAAHGRGSFEASPSCSELYLVSLGKLQGLRLGSLYHSLPALMGGWGNSNIQSEYSFSLCPLSFLNTSTCLRNSGLWLQVQYYADIAALLLVPRACFTIVLLAQMSLLMCRCAVVTYVPMVKSDQAMQKLSLKLQVWSYIYWQNCQYVYLEKADYKLPIPKGTIGSPVLEV